MSGRPKTKSDCFVAPLPVAGRAGSKGKGAVIEDAEMARLKRVAQIIKFREFQQPVWFDRKSGIVVLHWARQIGKSFTLAAWALDRILGNPGRLVVVLSNSRENGAEFLQKCVQVANLLGTAHETLDESSEVSFDNLKMEMRVWVENKLSRIKILAANPRTARGFSGDLILDEFAFHEDSAAIWEAAEPILASNKDFLCRIASTGNGKHNMFYRMAAPGTGGETGLRRRVSEGLAEAQSGLVVSAGGFLVSRVTRTQAHGLGVDIFDPQSREKITPVEARAAALDKRAYDQNYECVFADENLTLLSHALISAAEREGVGEISEQDWSGSQLARLRQAGGPLFAGFDVGRKIDLSVVTVLEKLGEMFLVRAILRIRDMRLPEQQARLGEICRLPKFQRAAIDMTGLGLGLFEYAQNEFGAGRIHGINFATTVPATGAVRSEGRKSGTVRVTEALAMELLQCYEDRRIQQPGDAGLRDDLRKPERVTTPGGRVSIAATRDEAGHADHFWSLALALEAAGTASAPFAYEALRLRLPMLGNGKCLM